MGLSIYAHGIFDNKYLDTLLFSDNVFYETIIGFSIILLSIFLYFFLSKFNNSDYKKTNIT